MQNKEFGDGILYCGQLGPCAWERLRSKSGARGGRPVAFTEGERGRGNGWVKEEGGQRPYMLMQEQI